MMKEYIIKFLTSRKIALFIAAAISAIALYICFVSTDFNSLSDLQPQSNWVSESDNLFFPIYRLDNMVFPFQKLFQNIVFLHLPAALSFLKILIVLSPVFLAMSAGMAHSLLAGIISAVFVFLMLQDHGSETIRNLEQLVIASSALASISSFLYFKKRPALRYAVLSLSLAALAQSKGVCFPIVFIFVFFEAICRKREKKPVWPAILIALPFLVAGLAWNIVSAYENPGSRVFFTESGGRLIPNLIAGAYGLAGTTEGQAGQAAGTMGVADSFYVAAKMVISNPAAYFGSIWGRYCILSKSRWYVSPLVILWLFSFAALIRRPKLLIAPLCAAYLFIVYILMPIEERYFIPPWVIMFVCAAFVISEIPSAIADFFSKSAGMREHAMFFLRPFSKTTASSLIFVFFAPHSLIFLASIVLLVTFPMRRKGFDIEKAYSLFPDNRYMAVCPLRKDYPKVWDYRARSELVKKTSDNLEFEMYQVRWFDFFSSEKNENEIAPGMPLTFINGNEYITWPDILLKAAQNYKIGNKKEGRRLAEAAALSCMLSSGYIRTNRGEDTSYTEQEKEYADRLALASAHECSNHMAMQFYSIPPWEQKLKETMAEDGFEKYFQEKNLIGLYHEKKSPDCGQCCVPEGFLEVPSKCGFAVKHFFSNYACFDDYVCKGHNWCRGQIDSTPQEKKFCRELNNKITEEDIALAGKYPLLKEPFIYGIIVKAALTSALADMVAGDRASAAKNLKKALQIDPGIVEDPTYKYVHDYIMGKRSAQ